ncbi:MAG: LysM peptidoglycan-binding domain-containing protein [Bdellovibrionales bacterium]|nr:LysM peptidoglycan-binding domain-containing protein [Bdellovibrionales bacterium]
MTKIIFIFTLLSMGFVFATDDLDLVDGSDANILLDDQEIKSTIDVDDLNLSALEESDDLHSLKNDAGDIIFKNDGITDDSELFEDETIDVSKIVNDQLVSESTNQIKPEIFDVGEEEKKLLELSHFVENKIPDNEWSEISAVSQTAKYVVQEGDYLWQISKTLFGSGFYYSKIWSLNPHITNPHEIEPGMVLVFETGDTDLMPQVQVGEFSNLGLVGGSKTTTDKQFFDFKEFGDDAEPSWVKQRRGLMSQGVYFQYASDATYEYLSEIGKLNLNKEYQKYEPPYSEIIIEEPGEQYDETGFDKESKISFNIKEGFFLNTFITTNIVQDLGFIEAVPNESIFIQKFDKIFVNFDEDVKVRPGDRFSVYTADGKISHQVSDRSGYRYTMVAEIKTLRKVNNLWECAVEDLSGVLQRNDRVTIFTPKITRITKTFVKQNIEAAIINTFKDTDKGISFGDVVYLDRGRGDGVELGTIFELYSFFDRGTEKKITPDPSYKIGELTVISITDDFATALVSNSSSEISVSTIALSKTAEQAARSAKLRNKSMLNGIVNLENSALEQLDVELNLDGLTEDLLEKADSIKLTEDELEELERQEREKSIIKDHEKDLRELDKLEEQLIDAEGKLGESKLDEDKFLEQQDLDSIEKDSVAAQDPNSYGAMDDMEEELGLQYLNQDINERENPYGLTEFDLEEMDELMNTESE